jgi:protocatechuate 3,4-dioxygenase beta subunit
VILPSFLLALALAPQVGTLPERQPPRDAPPRADAAGTGIIRGHVVAADTGLPIRRAHVTLSMTQPPPVVAVGNASPPPPRAAPPMNFGTRQTLADAEGAFEFKNLPPGGYMVHASPWQFSGQYLGLAFGAQHPGPGVSGTPIHLAPGQVFDRATIALPRGAVIVGRVTDDMGQPIARAQVYGMWFPRGSKRGMRNGVGAQTDDLGQFRIYGLEPGDYGRPAC